MSRKKAQAQYKWHSEKPKRPCIFISRAKKVREPSAHYPDIDLRRPTLHYADIDTGILCVYDDREDFISTMEDFYDYEYFIVEFLPLKPNKKGEQK